MLDSSHDRISCASQKSTTVREAPEPEEVGLPMEKASDVPLLQQEYYCVKGSACFHARTTCSGLRVVRQPMRAWSSPPVGKRACKLCTQ